MYLREMHTGGEAISRAAKKAYDAWQADDMESTFDYLAEIEADAKTIARMAAETAASLKANLAS